MHPVSHPADGSSIGKFAYLPELAIPGPHTGWEPDCACTVDA